MCGVTKLAKIRNEIIMDNESWGNSKESTGRRLKWYGHHVMRREEHSVGTRAVGIN